MKLNRNIFREYDIRAVYEEDLKGNLPYYLGRALGSYLIRQDRKTICIGGDNRFTTDEMKTKIARGLLESGCNVTDIGTLPTPIVYFAIKEFKFDAGAVVTASHNPPEFNGLKMVVGEESLHGHEIQSIADIIEAEDFEDGKGKLVEMEIIDRYLHYMQKRFSFKKNFKIGVDTGNGVAGPVIEKLFNLIGLDFVPLYTDSNPAFPNHLPDPMVPANMEDLIDAVRKNSLDAGLGFDGDGDRLGVIDDKGQMLWGDRLMILYSREVIAKNPGSKIIFDVKCSRALAEEIEKKGGIPIMWKTGHSLIEAKMKLEKAPLAGELSGHIYFADEYYGYDDAIYAALRLLRIMDNSEMKLSDMLKDVQEYHATPEIRIEIPDEAKFRAVDKMKLFFEKHYSVSDIDGVRIDFPDGWALVRASNTQPALVIRAEGTTAGSLERIKKDFIPIVKNFIKDSNLP